MSEAILQIVAERVRAEFEQTIKDETERRYAAVLAAIEGRATVEPMPAPPPPTEPEPPKRERKPRSDRGQPRLGRAPTILPAEDPTVTESLTVGDSGSVNENPPAVNTEEPVSAVEAVRQLAEAIGPEGIAALAETDAGELRHGSEQDEDPGGLDAEDYPPDDDSEPLCATCQHTERVHGDPNHGSAACMAMECKCRRFVPPDPLGINDVDPKAREGSDATA